MLELLMLIAVVCLIAIAKRLKRIIYIMQHFKVEAVIPVYGHDDDPEPNARPNVAGNVIDGAFKFRRRVQP